MLRVAWFEARELGGCRLTVRLRPGPISLSVGTVVMETPSGPERVSRRLREQFAPAYLAISGLVQVDLPLALVMRHWYRGALAVAVTAFGLLGWLLYDPLGLASAPLAVGVGGLVGVVVIIASSVPMWNQILRYARGEPVGTGPRIGRRGRSGRDGQRLRGRCACWVRSSYHQVLDRHGMRQHNGAMAIRAA
jgi:hypothetical protein